MKILLLSERFCPRVGGVETVTRLLGSALVRLGHNVVVATRESGDLGAEFDFALLRRPGPVRLFWECATADAVIVQGLAIHLAWPLLWRRKSSLVVHHMQPGLEECAARGWLRRQLVRHSRHAAVSCALAQQLPWRVEAVLPNPYDAEVFRINRMTPRERDIIFVGRLIPEKGVRVLVRALLILRERGKSISATIVGDGPERGRLARELKDSGLDRNVQFAGEITGPRLAQMLNRHRLMVVPSLAAEGFGLVALEGIACGCVVIGSDTGGLPEAIGACGITFPAGNSELLAAKMWELLRSPGQIAAFQAADATHLAKHHPRVVAGRYVELLLRLPRCSATPGRRSGFQSNASGPSCLSRRGRRRNAVAGFGTEW